MPFSQPARAQPPEEKDFTNMLAHDDDSCLSMLECLLKANDLKDAEKRKPLHDLVMCCSGAGPGSQQGALPRSFLKPFLALLALQNHVVNKI